MAEKWLPSSLVPDYLKLELGVGTPSPSALIRALEDVCRGFDLLAAQTVLGIDPLYATPQQRRMHIEKSGLRCGELTDDEVLRLVQLLVNLSASTRFLLGIQSLAEVYFGEVEIELGGPGSGETNSASDFVRLGRTTRLAASGAASAPREILVRPRRAFDGKKAHEFESNCAQLLPQGVVARVVAGGQKKDDSPQPVVLRPGLRLVKGRI